MEILGFLPLIVVLAIVAVVILGDRKEPDPQRDRPLAVYLGTACFVGVAMLLMSVFVVVTGATSITEGARNHDEDVTGLVSGLIVAALAAGVVRFHLPQLKSVSDSPNGLRVFTRYVYITSFLALLVALGTAATAAFAVYGTVAPETANYDSWADAFRQLISMGVMAAASGLVLQWHWRQATELRAAETSAGAEVEPEPIAPPTPVRKRAPAKTATAKKAAPRKK